MLRQAAKKPLALLLAFVMVVSTVFTVVPATVSSADEVLRTNITSLNFAATADSSTNTIAFPDALPYIDGVSGVTIDSSLPGKYSVNSSTANTLKATGWGEGDYWSFLFHPTGYENYTISFYPRSSNTGVRDFKVQYSLDGSTWSDIEGATYQATNSYSVQQSFALPSELGSVSDLYIRMITTSGICVTAGTGSNAVDKPAATTGVTNIGTITLSGTMVEGYVPIVVQPVTASIPSESVVDPATEITLYSESVTASGAAIMMNVNGAEYDTMYTGPFTLASLGADEEHTEFTIATYAQVDETKSTYNTYTYYTEAMETIDIINARGKEDGTTRIQVEGIVNFIDGKNVYIEDSTAGIDLYLDTTPSDLAIGDKVVASGTKATSKGLEELTDVNYTIASHENALYSTNVTIAELLANPDTYECRRVHIEDAVLGAINTTGNTTLTQDTNTTNIYRIPALTGIEANATVKLDAVVGCYNTLQLRVVQASDVIKTADAPEVPDDGDDEAEDLTGVVDPVTDEMLTEAGAKSLKDAYSATIGDTITVLGQVAYQYGNVYNNANSINTIVLQDVIDNQIQGLAIYDYSNTYKTGDVIKVTGTVAENGSVRQISNVTAVETIATKTPFKPQERTIQQLLEGGDQYLSEYVLIKDVTLGAYKSTGATTITDATGTTTLYKGALLPDGVAEGSVVNLYCAWSKYNTSYQVRNGATTDYVSMNADGSTVDTSVVLPIANWAGTSNIVGATTILYGDKYSANDQLDLDSSLTVSTGVAPIIKTTSGTGTNYYLGAKGLAEGNYYELQCDSELLGNIKLSYTMKGSKTAPKNFKILYSTDGETFATAGTKSIAAASTSEKFEVTLPNEANNATKLWVRIQVADNVSIENATIGAGNNYLSEVALTGSPLVADTITGYPVITPESGEVQFGQEISITTATEGATIYYSINGAEYVEYNDASKPVITELPGEVTAYAVKAGLTDSLVVKNEYTQVQVAPVKANPNGGARTIGTKVKLSTATEGATIRYSLDNGVTWLNYNPEEQISLDVLPMTIITKAVLDGCKDSETTTCSYTLRENENYNIYFGQIHSHTDYSDGAGTCDQAFNYAKNTAEQIDFLAVTDHSNSFDNEKTASLADGSVSEEWKEGHQLADEYTDTSFVGIYGFEMTWSNGLGHMNTFNTNGFQSRTQSDYSQYSTALSNYYTTLKTDTSSISQFNHPGTTFGDFSDFAHYDEEIDSLITLIEVGNGEGAIGSDGYFPSYEYYTRALDKGWHVAPTNNQDNHKGYWGDANTGRTVILADSLTRENIYDALRNMRTYATEDNDLEVQYTLNGEVMGTVLEDTPAKADIKVQLNDPTDSAIGKVEVIVNGGLSVASENVTSNTANLEFDLPADYSYYYIRITQPDNETAVTAPVWVGKVEAVGISSISTTAALPVKGEALDVNLELFNNEPDELQIDSITYSIDDEIIHTVDLAAAGLTSLASCTTGSYSFDYTYDGTGGVNIYVTVNATLRGVSKVYKSVLQLTYVAPSMVTNVVIDGTHDNDYVTGYYGANMSNFTKIAADDNIKVTIVKDTMTKEILDSCDLLIISAPAKKNGSANAGAFTISHFEDSFLALVKEYTDRGGELIVCGIADYQDSADCQTSTEQNKLLSYIGATTRLNSDEAIDDVNNGGSNYRLYPTNYNADSAYTKGIVDGQKYSAYSGCTVLLDNAAVEAGKAEYLVKGFDSTYSINSKSLDSNYQEIEKGNAIFLAREALAGGGNVFVSSTVFMSDFEVKAEQDNIWDLPYINKNVIVNIMDSVKKQMDVSNIADVRNGTMGDIYCVEGTVTAGTVSGNAFFDTIYIQDATGGINIFPINEGLIEVGQKVKVVGSLDEYLGDKELRVISAEVIDTEKNPIAPTKMTTKEAMDYQSNGGKLVKVEGTITKVILKNDIVETIMVKDSSGVEARVFIDGYVLNSNASDVALESFVKAGNTISAVGLVSYDPDGERLRVRDRSEIVLVSQQTSDGSTSGDGENTTDKGVTTVTEDKEKNTQTTTNVVTQTNTNNVTIITTTETVIDKETGTQISNTVKIVATTQGETQDEQVIITRDDKNVVQKIEAVVAPKELSSKETDKTAILSTTIAEDVLLAAKEYASAEVPVEVAIDLPSSDINKQIDKKDINKVEIVVTIPTSVQEEEKIIINELNIKKPVISNAKTSKKDIHVIIADEKGMEQYSWLFNGENLKKSNKKVTDVNTAVNITTVDQVDAINALLADSMTKEERETGIVLDFQHSGVLPTQATVRIYVGDTMKPGDKVYLYYYNEKATTGTKRKNQARLEATSKVAYTVDKDGYTKVKIKHCSSYVLLPEKADTKIAATLFEQIKAVSKKTIKVKKTANLALTLPIDAEDAKVVYSSSKKSVATVNKAGKVTAKKAGKTTITAKVTINGVTKSYKTTVTVK